jgi:hypothetical protein
VRTLDLAPALITQIRNVGTNPFTTITVDKARISYAVAAGEGAESVLYGAVQYGHLDSEGTFMFASEHRFTISDADWVKYCEAPADGTKSRVWNLEEAARLYLVAKGLI